MQTFLSESTFAQCAAVLDKKRLNKQLTEARQILGILTINKQSRWRNHPAVNMWRGYEIALIHYINEIAKECHQRNINIQKNLTTVLAIANEFLVGTQYVEPIWWADPKYKHRVLTTHRARLFEKSAVLYPQYEQYQPQKISHVCCGHCNYFWPSHFLKQADFTGVRYVDTKTIASNA